MRPSADFTTLQAVRRQLAQELPSGATAAQIAEDTAANELITLYIREASSWIQEHCNRTFVPYVATREYPSFEYRGRFLLDEDLLSLTSVSVDGTALDSGDYIAFPYNARPYRSVYFQPGSVVFSALKDVNKKFSIAGVWGFHEDYNNAWKSLTTLSANISSTTATSISVTSATGFEVLQYIKVGDEVMQVTAITTTPTPALTVVRAALGTTATTHTSGATVLRFVPSGQAILLATRLAAWLYQKRTDNGDRVAFTDGSITLSELPVVVRSLLPQLKRIRWGVA